MYGIGNSGCRCGYGVGATICVYHLLSKQQFYRMRQGAENSSRIILDLVACCLQLQNANEDDDGRIPAVFQVKEKSLPYESTDPCMGRSNVFPSKPLCLLGYSQWLEKDRTGSCC